MHEIYLVEETNLPYPLSNIHAENVDLLRRNELKGFIPIPLYHVYSREALTPDPRNLFIPRCCCPDVPTMPLYDVLYALDCVGHKALHSGGQRLVIDE